jgi:hypothetical protein
MGIAPAPGFPERAPVTYERKMAVPGERRGPLRFEEGLATDTDIPNDFQRGMTEALSPAPGSQNHVNPEVLYKHANETMAERAHVGSAAWVDSPAFLGDYAGGAGEGNQVEYLQVTRSGGRYGRPNGALVTD